MHFDNECSSAQPTQLQHPWSQSRGTSSNFIYRLVLFLGQRISHFCQKPDFKLIFCIVKAWPSSCFQTFQNLVPQKTNTKQNVTKPKTSSVFVHKRFMTFAFCRLTTQFPPSSLMTWVLCCKFPSRSHKTELFTLGSLWLTNHFFSCSEYCTLRTIKVHNIVVMMQ